MAEPYRVCVVGCGSIGLHLAACLSLGKRASISAIARGETLAALKRGAEVRGFNGAFSHKFRFDRVSDKAAEIREGGIDAIIVAVKSTQLAAVTGTLKELLEGADAKLPVFFALNGIPWYYFHAEGGAREGQQLPLLDPSGDLWRLVTPERAVHVVCQTASLVESPGVVQVNSPVSTFLLCEPSCKSSPRTQRLADALQGTPITVQVNTSFREEVWFKLLGNVVFNPVSVLTGGIVCQIARAQELRDVVLRPTMLEMAAVAKALGVASARLSQTDARLDRVKENTHPPSMLQDFQARRELETDALLAQVQAFGKELGVATPTIDIVLSLVLAAADFQRGAPITPGSKL